METNKKTTTWENLRITDSFIFGAVMQNSEICKELLELILDIKIDHIEYPATEKTMKLTHDGKGVRDIIKVSLIWSLLKKASDIVI